jgi:uncharacterized protein (DUF1015 family)
VAFPHDEVQVLAYNRAVKDLGGHTPQSLVDALRSRTTITEGPPAPVRPGQVAMFLDGRWRTVVLPSAPSGRAAADMLDVSRLHDEVLAPLLGIGDIRTDPRVEFVGAGRGTAHLERLVASGAAAVAFSMHPVTVDDLMRVCDAGGIMPPKSTWFEPKLRDGLLSHLI